MKTNSWLYHYYMVQSRLQYGLAYGAHSPGLPYYPHMLGAPAQPQPFAAYDPGAGLGPAYLSSSHHNFGNSGLSSSSLSSSLSSPLYPSYLYTPPHHYLQPPPPPQDHSAQLTTTPVRESKDHHGPLDFSRSQAEYNSSQQSSPSLRSDSSSSPVYHPPHDSLYGSPEVAVLSQAGRHHSISDHHYKTNHRVAESHPHTRLRDQAAPHHHPHISFWSDTQLSGFEKYKPDIDSPESGDRKRVKKEAEFYSSSDSNNNSDGPPTYYSLDQLHLQHH